MATLLKRIILCHAAAPNSTTEPSNAKWHARPPTCLIGPTSLEKSPTRRWALTSTLLAATSGILIGFGNATPPVAFAEAWGARSYIMEHYFQPDLSPEDAAARIHQTAEGMRDMRHMLDVMAWKYVLRYVRLKMAYLSSDLKNAMTLLPESRRKDYVKGANELVENMSQLDRYLRTPKVYESYLYYEKTLKSLDGVAAMLA